MNEWFSFLVMLRQKVREEFVGHDLSPRVFLEKKSIFFIDSASDGGMEPYVHIKDGQACQIT